MYGAILGDIIGSPYEWRNKKSKDFPLFNRWSRFTDDTVMTLAVAEGFMNAFDDESLGIHEPENLNESNRHLVEESVVRSMKKYGLKYYDAGYGGRFREWLKDGTGPYFSWGNGSAMRVSAAAWITTRLDNARELAALQAAVTHNHPEGVKGAEAIASAIFIARTGATKQDIKEYIEKEFGYDLDRTCDEIRLTYKFDVSCQGSVPEAIIAFLEGSSFEDVIRNAVSLGGDSDTIAAMAGGIAEAYYCIPYDLMTICEEMLPPDLRAILLKFSADYQPDIYMNKPETAKNIKEAKVVTREAWENQPMPEEHEIFVLHRHFNERQMDTLRLGHIPGEMEDKWFWYMEGNTLYAHRSWTGFCRYVAEFRPDDTIVVTVSRDPEQYKGTDIEKDAQALDSLLSWWSQPDYDYYSEWLSETYTALMDAGAIPKN